MLNCFCYTGGFSLAALKGGAKRVVSIDSSGEALALAQQNVTANGFDAERATWLDADAFKTLRRLYDEGERFDLIVLDPPKFAPSREHVDRAARAYKDINLTGLKLLRPGGLLFTYSCSGAIDADLFQKIVAGAAADAKRRRAHPEAARRGRRSSAAHRISRRRIPERPIVANRLIAHSFGYFLAAAGSRQTERPA